MFRLAILGTASALVLIAFTHAGSVSAQYPPPNGNCTLSIDATQVSPGGTAGVTVTVLDAASNPKGGVAVTVQVSGQPGSDASVNMNSATTGANGKVTGTLHVGTAGGVVKLTANQEGGNCGAQVVVGQGEVAPEVNLPNTGSGTNADGPSKGLLALLALVGGAVIAVGVGMRRTSRG